MFGQARENQLRGKGRSERKALQFLFPCKKTRELRTYFKIDICVFLLHFMMVT